MRQISKLTREQIAEIKSYLDSGKNLPEDYRYVLFPPPKVECELVYADKERLEDVLAQAWAVPLQPVKTFGSEHDHDSKDWVNRLIFGDNLQAMKRLLDDPQVKGQVKLVYIDPPFATRREFQGTQEQKAYQDKVAGAEFVEFIRKRLVMIRELMHENGSVYVHLDQKKSHYLKVVLDEVFGEENFRNEIIWRNTNAHNKAETFGQVHQNLFLYSKRTEFSFYKTKRPRFKEYEDQHYRHKDKRGVYRLSDLTADGVRGGESGKEWLGYNPTKISRHWAIPGYVYDLIDRDISSLSVLGKLDYLRKADLIVPPSSAGGQPQVKRYKNDDDGIFLQDIWAYQPYTSGIYADSKECIDEDVSWAIGKEERTEYPTQKPEGLLARIIHSSSEKGDLILDAFAGSGTTLSVAEKLGRRWIGIDCGKLSVYSIQKRMLNLHTKIGNEGSSLKVRPFTLFNAGLYDFERIRELPWEDYRLFALQLFQIRDEQHSVSGIQLDGYKGASDALIFNYRAQKGVQLDLGFVEELHLQLGGKSRNEFFVVAPAACVTFLEDYIDHGKTRYYILRIPYSIIDELHDRPFQEIRQPVDEMHVNDTVDAVGFDFIQPPTVRVAYSMKRPKGELFEFATIQVEKFESQAMTRNPREFKNRETLSMVMIDYDYKSNGDEVFDLDVVFYRDQIEENGWEIRLDPRVFGKRVMIIYVDIFGNELREIKCIEDFKSGGSRSRVKSDHK